MRNHQVQPATPLSGAESGHAPIFSRNPYTGDCLDVEPLFRFFDANGSTIDQVAEQLDTIAFMLIENADNRDLSTDPLLFKNAQGWAKNLRNLFMELAKTDATCDR